MSKTFVFVYNYSFSYSLVASANIIGWYSRVQYMGGGNWQSVPLDIKSLQGVWKACGSVFQIYTFPVLWL